MGKGIFSNYGVDIAAEIHKYVSPGLLAATLTKKTPGTRTPGQLTGGTNPTSTAYPCKGMLDSQSRRNQDGTLLEDGTLKALLTGDSIDAGATVPEIGDTLTIEGGTYRIEKADRDPDAATYTLVVRPFN